MRIYYTYYYTNLQHDESDARIQDEKNRVVQRDLCEAYNPGLSWIAGEMESWILRLYFGPFTTACSQKSNSNLHSSSSFASAVVNCSCRVPVYFCRQDHVAAQNSPCTLFSLISALAERKT